MDKDVFVLTEQHVKLLRRMWVGWTDAEFGAPEIDPKRPYGNSDVIRDVVEILEMPTFRDRHGETTWAPETTQLAARLHAETKRALQVALSAGSFEPGRYESEKYANEWRRAD